MTLIWSDGYAAGIMEQLAGTVAAAVGLFAGTNVDDLLVLTLLFLSARATGVPKTWQIWAGQYAGIALLVAFSALAAFGLTLVPDDKVRFLGLIPLGLGLWTLFKRHRDEDTPVAARTARAIAAVTVANGADNIAVYTPVFRAISVEASLVTISVFALLVAVWVLAGSWLGSHPRMVKFVRSHGHWAVPGVFIVIGIVILLG